MRRQAQVMSGARAGRDWCERSFRKRTPFRLLWPRLMSVSFVYVCVCILVWVGLHVCGSVCVCLWKGGGASNSTSFSTHSPHKKHTQAYFTVWDFFYWHRYADELVRDSIKC